MLPKTRERVVQHTAPSVNRKIQNKTTENISRFAQLSPEEIDRRLQELDREWDVERTLEANAAVITLVTLLLGIRSKKLRLFPLAVAGFLLQHALQGWCPPVPIFRRLGIRTLSEINQERLALQVVRGDFSPQGKSNGKANSGQRLK